MKRLDIVDVKKNIKEGYVRLVFHNGNVLLVDNASGEAVKIGELRMGGSVSMIDGHIAKTQPMETIEEAIEAWNRRTDNGKSAD